jgi:hypothetical protein
MVYILGNNTLTTVSYLKTVRWKMSMSVDMLVDAAGRLGTEHGRQRAEWVDVFGLTPYAAKNIISGYETKHDKTMELCPKPLSAEWADDPTHLQVIDKIANLAEAYELVESNDKSIEDALEDTDNILDVYEKAFEQAFWDKVIGTCKKILGEAN